MKKIIKIILCNILVCFVILGILELGLYLNYKKNHPEIKYSIKEVSYDTVLDYYDEKPVQGENYSKRPIILAGCSFAYGQGLENEQTFGYKLAHITKRPVYNFSLPGKGFQHNLYFIQNKMYEQNIKNPEYFVYVMMSDQIRRLYTTVCLHDYTAFPEYGLNRNNKLYLKRNIYPFYKQFYVYYFFNNLYYTLIGYKNYKEHSILVREYLREIKNAIKNDFSDIKFVVLFYGDYEKYYKLDLQELEKEDFIFIHTQDLSDINVFENDYHLTPTDFHPNEKAWDILTPEFAKALNL